MQYSTIPRRDLHHDANKFVTALIDAPHHQGKAASSIQEHFGVCQLICQNIEIMRTETFHSIFLLLQHKPHFFVVCTGMPRYNEVKQLLIKRN